MSTACCFAYECGRKLCPDRDLGVLRSGFMPFLRRRLRTLGVSLALSVALLAACSHSSGISPTVLDHFHGGPSGVVVPRGNGLKPFVAWDGPHRLFLMTYGSGSCPKVPASVTAEDRNVLVVKTEEHSFNAGDTACTDDLSPTTSVVRLPAAITAAHSLRVLVDGSMLRLEPQP